MIHADDADLLWSTLCPDGDVRVRPPVDHLSLSPNKDINYEEFKEIGQEVNEKFREFFKPSLFLSLARGNVLSTVQFFNFVVKKGTLYLLSY